MEVVLLIFRLLLAGVFGVAGVAKLLDPEGSKVAFAAFGVPKVFINPAVYLLPAVELLTAILLLFVDTSWFGAIVAAALFSIFTAGMLYQMAKGNAPDCHCFGQLQSEPVGKVSVLRNSALLIVAAVLVISGKDGQGTNLINSDQDVMQFVIGLAVVGLLAAVVFFLKRISEQQTQIMRRIELMELVARDGTSVERENVGHPHEGLPIGAIFPDFELADVNGEKQSLKKVRAHDLPVLFLFVSPTCNPCKALLPEFEQWQNELGGKVRFVFVSNGKAEENIDKFGGELTKTILLQKQRELADQVEAKWTPTAILIDRNGRLASHATAGDTAIRALVENIKTEDLAQEFKYFTNGNEHSHTNKIGSDIPSFSLQDIKGQEINSDYFRGKQTLVTFWSQTCPHCTAMVKDLQEWERSRGAGDPSLIVFSDGDRESLKEFDLASPIVPDEGHKTSAGFGMFGTPSAVLVNEDGKIISETATGAPNIWSLIGKK